MSHYFYNKELDEIRLKLRSDEIEKLEGALSEIANAIGKKDTVHKSELSKDDITRLEGCINNWNLAEDQKGKLNPIIADIVNEKVHKEINAQVFIEQERLRIYEFYLNLRRQFHKVRQLFTAIVFIAILLALVGCKYDAYNKLKEFFHLNSNEIVVIAVFGVLLLFLMYAMFKKYTVYILNRCTTERRIDFIKKCFLENGQKGVNNTKNQEDKLVQLNDMNIVKSTTKVKVRATIKHDTVITKNGVNQQEQSTCCIKKLINRICRKVASAVTANKFNT